MLLEIKKLISNHKENHETIIFLVQDLLMTNPEVVLNQKLDEIIWNKGFYAIFKNLQQAVGPNWDYNVALKLKDELDYALAFYRYLVADITATFIDIDGNEYTLDKGNVRDKNHDKNNKTCANILLYRSRVHLGDISRYMVLNQMVDNRPSRIDLADRDWSQALAYYNSAIQVDCHGGSPYAQLAVISFYQMDSFNVVYYNCLSMGNIDRGIGRSNLIKYLEKKSLDDQCMDQKFFSLFYAMAQYETAIIPEIFTAATQFVDTGCPPKNNMNISKKVLCWIILFTDLDRGFLENTNPATKQSIRFLQYITMYILFHISSNCNEFFFENFVAENSEFKVQDAANSDHLIATSIFCQWLVIDTTRISKYLPNSKLVHETDFELILLAWVASIVKVANGISWYADFDGSGIQVCESDRHLVPLASFTGKFGGMVPKQYGMNSSLIHCSRIAQLVQDLANDNGFMYIIQKHDTGQFMTKRDKLMHTMGILASERLKSHVQILEGKLQTYKEFQGAVFLLDVDCFLYKLWLVKSALMAKSCTICVSLDVIQTLNVLKEDAGDGVHARDATRYLAQKLRYPCPYLIGQKPEEARDVREVAGEQVDGRYRGILGACIFFRGEAREKDKKREFYMVTDSGQLKMWCAKLKIESMSLRKFKATLPEVGIK